MVSRFDKETRHRKAEMFRLAALGSSYSKVGRRFGDLDSTTVRDHCIDVFEETNCDVGKRFNISWIREEWDEGKEFDLELWANTGLGAINYFRPTTAGQLVVTNGVYLGHTRTPRTPWYKKLWKFFVDFFVN